MRNYIHMNLFVSFILKAISVLVIDALLNTHYNEKIDLYSVGLRQSAEVMYLFPTPLFYFKFSLAPLIAPIIQ